MLKKILGEAPFELEMNDGVVISPDKAQKSTLTFRNSSEYDLPLSCSIGNLSFLNVDKLSFDVTVPAEGVTSAEITFSVSGNSRIFGGRKICELEICDRIFDSRTQYEFEVMCEFACKCCGDKKDAFVASEKMLFSRNGTVFANRGEVISLEVPCLERAEVLLHIISGKIKDFGDGELIAFSEGLNRLCFEIEEDGSFEFLNPVSEEKIFPDTVSPEYFM